MSLNQSVKNFFISKINTKIAQDIKAIEETINRKELEEQAFEMFVKENDLSEVYDLIAFSAQIQSLKKQKEDLENELYAVCKAAGVSVNSYSYNRDIPSEVKEQARKQFLDKLMDENYPKEQKEIKKLRALQEDVEGVVLLATTPNRLREALTSLLNEYGGQLEGIEKIVDLSK